MNRRRDDGVVALHAKIQVLFIHFVLFPSGQDRNNPRVSGRARSSLFGRDRMAQRVFQAYVELAN